MASAIGVITAAFLFRAGPVLSSEGGGDAARDPARPWFQQLAPAPQALDPAVDFLARPPEIDGRLDPALQDLPVRNFSFLWKSRRDNPDPRASYRLAYGADFFYLYLEAEGDSLHFRDRAFQNGDGFAFVLARPRPGGEASEEFYVVACSAVGDPSQEWARTVFWYVNVSRLFVPAGGARLEFSAGEGRIRFELLLPWAEVPPFHPWLSGEAGFDLAFTQAVGTGERNRLADLPDEVGAEMKPRKYALLRFAEPGREALSALPSIQTFAFPSRRNVTVGDSLSFDVAVLSPSAQSTPLVLRLLTGEGERLGGRRKFLALVPGLNRFEVRLGIDRRPAGAYAVEWSAEGRRFQGRTGLSILPALDPTEAARRLAAEGATAGGPSQGAGSLREGDRVTLVFLAQELERDLSQLKPYETAGPLRLRLEELGGALEQADKGKADWAILPGVQRRAFRSLIDSTSQPYALRLPSGYDPARPLPLLVFLHGSASDETSLRGTSWLSEGRCLEIAPRGRGVSNAFATAEAQTDILEAIADARRLYRCDSTRTILAGFSMGGYGVYRSFYEHPERYRALAVFSGGPDLGNRFAWAERPPDFSKPEYLAPFRGVPIFIFHGRQDRNVSYESTVGLVEKLREAGAIVEFVSDPERGHESPGPDGIAAWRRWLDGVLRTGP